MEWMTREDAELEGVRKSKQQHWVAHLDAVTAAVTSKQVRRNYRNHLVRFVLFLCNNTTTDGTEVDDSSTEGEDSKEESKEGGVANLDYDLLHDL